MSYAVQGQLESDTDFAARCRAVIEEQSLVYINDGRPDFQAMAMSLLRIEPTTLNAFSRMLLSTPGFADSADMGDGTIESDNITDADLLSATQGQYPTMVTLFFDAEGNRIPGTE
jgi:hypothetical protein